MRYAVLLLLLFCTQPEVVAQSGEKQLTHIKARMDSIQQFNATMSLHVAISFIQMPDKEAEVLYTRGEEVKVISENFTLIPKRGLDFSFKELFEFPFLVVERASSETNNNSEITVSILPQDDRANFSVATLQLDTLYHRITSAAISTKKDGTYDLQLSYPDTAAILPTTIRVSFEMDRIRIPLNFAGKDVVIDRKKMREQEVKKGSIVLTFIYKSIIK